MNLQRGSGKIRFARSSTGGLFLLLVISADWRGSFSQFSTAEHQGQCFAASLDQVYGNRRTLRCSRSSHLLGSGCKQQLLADSPGTASCKSGALADSLDPQGIDSTSHPYIDARELKSGTCLTCHPAKNQGKFVHTAVARGCESCHVVVSTVDQTVITLVATGGDLCARCHVGSSGPVQHAPYAGGQCLVCHNPHSAAYPAQTRASVSTLCLACHMLNQPEVTMVAEAKNVTLLDGMSYDLAAWRSAPKITSRHFEKPIPRREGAEAGAQKLVKGEAGVDCLACHEPHAGKSHHLLRKGVEVPAAGSLPRDSRASESVCAHWHLGAVPELPATSIRGRA